MKRIFTRSLSAILALILSLAVVSCDKEEKDREYNAEEVAAAAKALIEKSQVLNEIYYGEGIPINTDATATASIYFEASYEWMYNNSDMDTLDKIKKMTTDVYTNSCSEMIFATILNSTTDASGQIEGFARYYQKYEADDPNGIPESIMVNVRWEPLLKAKNTFLYDTLTVTHSKGEYVYVTIDISVEADGQTKTVSKAIALLEENGAWRIDNPTFAN